MKRPLKAIVKWFDAVQRRFGRARPASVLIMVVALLVLLALIGTAAMSTARMDRVSSAQNVANTQVEMLADGVKQMVLAQLMLDLNGEKDASSSDSLKNFFNDTDSTMSNAYQANHGTQDAILGSRLPERLVVANSSGANIAGGAPIWRSVSYPPFTNGNAIALNYFSQFRFDPPNDSSANDQPLEKGTDGNALQLPKSAMMPTFYPFQGENLPGLQPVFADGSFGQKFMAADADGDGIADALLFRLPISPIRGITYYAAIRVVDNGAALNLNTARTPDDEVGAILVRNPSSTDPTATKPSTASFAGMFPPSINLHDLLIGSNEAKLHDSQLQTGSPNSAVAPFMPSTISGDDPDPTKKNTPIGPYRWQLDNQPAACWLTPGDWMHHQLVRRLDNPGFLTAGAGGGTFWGNGVRPFGVSGSLALARGFTLVDPSAHDSLVELMFYNSLVETTGSKIVKVSARPYPASAADINQWFTDNFDYETTTGAAPLRRALFTTLNPVRNSVFRHDTGAQYPSSVGANSWLGISPQPTAPALPTAVQYPTKTNLNTAAFPELYASFFDVMCDGILNTPFDDDAGMNETDPYKGMHFKENDPTFASIAEIHPSRMFRSPLRAPGVNTTDRLQPYQVMQLRSAIAAMNVWQGRTPYDVAPQTVNLVPLANGKVYSARIYGLRPQPFITEVYVNNNPDPQVAAGAGGAGGAGGGGGGAVPAPPAPPGGGGGTSKQNPSGFAAIELHNPYDDPISVTGWALATLDRSTFPAMSMNGLGAGPVFVFPNDSNPDPTVAPDKRLMIPPHGYLVIWNYNGDNGGGGNDADTAQYLPAKMKDILEPKDTKDEKFNWKTGGVRKFYFPKLHEMMGKEIVLLRQVQSIAGLDYAPADSFDCSGLMHAATPVQGGPLATEAKSWHYVRANDTRQPAAGLPTRAWHFVYPGRYDGSHGDRRQQGTEETTWDPSKVEEPWVAMPPPTPIIMGQESSFGSKDTLWAHSYNSREGGVNGVANSSFPIQIANNDSGRQLTGPDVEGKPALYFPFHGFARAGDVMQAPYIGSYIITDPAAGNQNTQTIVEANAVTMDAAFAEDTDTLNDVETSDTYTLGHPEDIGRFSPPLAELTYRHITGTTDTVNVTKLTDAQRREYTGYWDNCNLIIYNNDQSVNTPWRRQFRHVTSYKSFGTNGGEFTLDKPLNGPLAGSYTYKVQDARYGSYAWASDILEYFTTINSPAEDFTPNADPVNSVFNTQPTAVRNISDSTHAVNRLGSPTEDEVPLEGLVNINTANWKVLAALPLVMSGNPGAVPTMDRALSQKLAKEIVYFRDVDDGMGVASTSGGQKPPHPHGPFKSLMELCLIPNFFTAEGSIDLSFDVTKNPGLDRGDYSPVRNTGDNADGTYGDNVRQDFEEKYLNLTRISNLLTLRSDCYTVYLQVQGWRDAGSANARLMVQRRLAFIVDRSHVTPQKPTPTVYNVQVPASGR